MPSNPDPTYLPALRVVTAVTQASPATITTDIDHDYITGIIGRMIIPDGFGMKQLHDLVGTITVVTPNTFTIDIDTSGFDAFAVPAGAVQEAQFIPFGEINSILRAALRNVVRTGSL